MANLLERAEVLAQLTSLARRVRPGSGQVVLLRGEAGVGKTAVLGQFVTELDPRLMVLRGWCDALAVPRPLGPLIDALTGLGDAGSDLAAALEAGDTAQLYRRLVDLLRDGHRWVWVIEDIHWSDAATLDLVRFLARRIDSLPLLLVMSYRDDEIGPQHPLAVALGDLTGSPAVERVGVRPLSAAAVSTLAAGSGVNAEKLHDLTGGNPFFVTEVLSAGPEALTRDTLPRSISEAVWGRLARLSTSACETAYAAAVCGPRAGIDLLEHVYPAATSGALVECLASGVLLADADVVWFRHELARQATLERMPEFARRALHQRAMVALAEPPIDADTLAALVIHADQAGDRDAVLRHGPTAAERAAGLGAHRQAAELYALVLSHAGDTPVPQLVQWLERHAFESYLCGLGGEAVSSWKHARRLHRVLGDALSESVDLRLLSHVMWAEGCGEESDELARASLRLVQDAETCPQLAWSLVNIAEVAAWGFDPAAIGYAERALAVGTELGDEAAVLRARGAASTAQVFRTDTGWDELEQVWRRLLVIDPYGEHVGLLANVVCWAATLHRDPDRADFYIAESMAYCRDRDLLAFELFLRGVEAMRDLHRGEWVRAAACVEDVLSRPGTHTLIKILPRLVLALINCRRGKQPVGALLDAVVANSDSDHQRLFGVWAVRAEVAWLAGDDAAARAAARAGLSAAADRCGPWLVGPLRRWNYLAGASEVDPAIELSTPYELEVSGRWQAAAQEWERRGSPYDAAIAQLGGDVDAVQAALVTFRGLGATAAARRAQQRLATLRGRTMRSHRSDTLADPDGLTRRQREVLQLLVAGRSNADIAAALYISPKTAAHHVAAVLAKLGTTSRTQAVAQVLQRRHDTEF